MATYYISRDNNAPVDIGAGNFYVTASKEAVLYVVPAGTAEGNYASASAGTYVIGAGQSRIYVPSAHRVAVVSAYRDLWLYSADVHSEEGPVVPKQKIWFWDDMSVQPQSELNEFRIYGDFRVGNYQLVAKAFSHTKVAGAKLEFWIRSHDDKTLRVNFGQPTSFVDNSTWNGTEVNVDFQFYLKAPTPSFFIAISNDNVVKPYIWIKSID